MSVKWTTILVCAFKDRISHLSSKMAKQWFFIVTDWDQTEFRCLAEYSYQILHLFRQECFIVQVFSKESDCLILDAIECSNRAEIARFQIEVIFFINDDATSSLKIFNCILN